MKTTNFYPFISIEKRMDGNNYMTFFPKFYTQSISSTNPKTGIKTITRYVAKEPLNGFHCHPAFMVDGEETETGILISSYFWSGSLDTPQSNPTGSVISNKTLAQFKTALEENADYHIMTIHEWAMIQLLLLLDAQGTEITYNISGTKDMMPTGGVYHYYMSDIVGRLNTFFTDGFRTDSTGQFIILKNDGSGEEVETGVTANTTNTWYPVDLLDDEGEGFNFKDLFVARQKSSDMASGSFYTQQYFQANKIIMPSQSGGALGLTPNATTYTAAARFVKYV